MLVRNMFQYFLSLCLLLSVTSCAAKSNSPELLIAPSETPEATSLVEMSISETLGKTIADIPIDAGTQVYAELNGVKSISVYFTPAVTDFDVPSPSTTLVSAVDKKILDGKVSALVFSLKEEAKFLLSKQSDTSARLMLVSDHVAAPQLPTNYITGLNFKPANGALQITMYSSLPFEVTPGKREDITLHLGKAIFQDSLLKKYDLTQLSSGFTSVTAINGNEGAYLLFSGGQKPEISLLRKGDETSLLVKNLRGPSPTPAIPAKASPALTPPDAFPEQDSNIVELNTLFPGMKERYTGERISIDLQNAEVEHVLRLISEISGYNLILDDAVTGKISLKLVDIPWDQALDLVLAQRNLGMVLKGNLMRITSAESLETERNMLQKAREAAVQAMESMQKLAPLKTEYLQINYNTAADFEGKIKTYLSTRGSTSSDTRTNTLIVTDTEDVLKRINSYIKKLDRPERQVMIEARIVYATDEFQRSLGVQWGFRYTRDGEQWRGGVNANGLNLLNTAGNTALLGGNIGKYLGKDLFTLDAQLRLGETKNLVKTISSPRILTLNNNRAEIQQGTKLATASESQSGGTTTEYEEAVLKISVLPQITPDDRLILDLEISDDSPKSDGRDIDTKQTKTKMMVGDRETIVIGGVFKSTETTGTDKIPGLGDVPAMGWLFKNQFTKNDKAELLIFIQPRIINDNSI